MKRGLWDPVNRRILLGTREAAWTAVERARQNGTPLVAWCDGKVVEVSPEEVPARKLSARPLRGAHSSKKASGH
jgi:hypothetical protein